VAGCALTGRALRTIVKSPLLCQQPSVPRRAAQSILVGTNERTNRGLLQQQSRARACRDICVCARARRACGISFQIADLKKSILSG